MRWSLGVLLCFTSMLALAQEGGLRADLRGEGTRVSDACGGFSLNTVPGCGYELFTDHPLHIAAGSMPPQNGFGLGGAFVWSKNTKNWRLSADVDAVGATSGAWRAGAYLKLIHTPRETIHIIVSQPGEKPKKAGPLVHPYTVFNLYTQSISLNKLNFFGLGNDTTLAEASVFGMPQTVVGASVVVVVLVDPAAFATLAAGGVMVTVAQAPACSSVATSLYGEKFWITPWLTRNTANTSDSGPATYCVRKYRAAA